MLIQNHLQLLEKTYKRKEGIADAYRVDEIDVDSYFFLISWTFLLKTTESSHLVKDLNMQPSLSENSSMMTT